MKRLYLVRHGIALPHGTPEVADDDRPLTSKGEKRVELISKGLRRLGVKPDRIVTSPLPRARTTAEIVAGVLGLEAELEDSHSLRPEATAGSLRDWLGAREEEQLMLVGHNPNLTELLGLLAGITGDLLPFVLKKGGVAALRDDGKGRSTIQWLATPRLIRRLSK